MAGLQAEHGSKTFNRDDLLKVFFNKIINNWQKYYKTKGKKL